MLKASYEVLQPPPGQSFLLKVFGELAFTAPYHFHPEYELTLITEGRGKRYVGNHMADFSPGDLVLIGPHLPHCWKLETGDSPAGKAGQSADKARAPETPGTAGKPDPAGAIVIQFTPDFLGNELFSKAEFSWVRKLLQNSSCGIQFPLSGEGRQGEAERLSGAGQSAAMQRLKGAEPKAAIRGLQGAGPKAAKERPAGAGQSAAREQPAGAERSAITERLKEADRRATMPSAEEKIRALAAEKNEFRKLIGLLELLQELALSGNAALLDTGPVTAEMPRADRERIHPIFVYLVENFRGEVSLPGAAAAIGMTPNAFCRYFKKITRKTFMETVIEYRLNYATQQLVQTDKPISAICFESGFGDISHFYKMFRSRMQLSPLNYRRQFMQETTEK